MQGTLKMSIASTSREDARYSVCKESSKELILLQKGIRGDW
jgi:hypothetical protein